MASNRSNRTYLLETSVHNSDLLAGKFSLPLKFFYRHRPCSLLSCSGALEVKECFFRSWRIRWRCHDFLFCPKTSLLSLLSVFSILLNQTIVYTFRVIIHFIVHLLIRCNSLDFFFLISCLLRCKNLFSLLTRTIKNFYVILSLQSTFSYTLVNKFILKRMVLTF